MRTLYPRLLPSETSALFDELHGRSIDELAKRAEFRSDRAVFAASGGTRATTDQLRALRLSIARVASDNGYPDTPNLRRRAVFDVEAAKILHAESGMAAGEAAQPQVWAFLALVVMPDICAWRFPPRSDGSYVPDRFKGTDLTRHTFARLWTRAHVLRERNAVDDAYRLLDVIGEADLDQIMARRKSVAASPALVRAIVRQFAGGVPTSGARSVLQEQLKRLLRLLAFLDVDGSDDAQLDSLVAESRAEAEASLMSDVAIE